MSVQTPIRSVLHGLFELRPAPPRRWFFSLRAAACMGAPILAGWWLGDTSAGLMASIGGFTSLYGSGRPYLRRARQLGAIALAFALAVGTGIWVAPSVSTVVFAVPLVAMISTWLSNALRIGPPGAYMFTLACAAATAMPAAAHLGPANAMLLVLGGGAFAWLLHMAGALIAPRGPERRAVAAAGKAVASYIEALGGPHENSARHNAAFALHEAWSVLVSEQPSGARITGVLGRLRALNRELHLCFAEAMGAAARHEKPPPGALDRARTLTAQVQNPEAIPAAASDSTPLGHPGALAAILEALRPGSNPMRVILRVGVAALVVGVAGAASHLERAYWAVAATVLMLHQGFDWVRMLRRSIERLLGTWIGLLLSGAILLLYPRGPWLALTVMALQFTIEMLVMRNYALAAVFITGAALTIASGGLPVEAPGGYLLARGVDTLAGCLVALLVFRLIPPRAAAPRITEQLVHVLGGVDETVPHLARGAVTRPEARTARRELQRASFELTHSYEDSLAASRAQRRAAEQMWPAIAATERLAYRTLSACWALERIGGEAAREAAASMFIDDGESRVHQALDSFVASILSGRAPPPLEAMPQVLEAELVNLHECLLREPPARPSSGAVHETSSQVTDS